MRDDTASALAEEVTRRGLEVARNFHTQHTRFRHFTLVTSHRLLLLTLVLEQSTALLEYVRPITLILFSRH